MIEENKIPEEEQPANKEPSDEDILPTGQAGSTAESITDAEQL